MAAFTDPSGALPKEGFHLLGRFAIGGATAWAVGALD
jgi:hypothetical protein